MVGDVKQSIYKFRQARPELFLEKYAKIFKDNYLIEMKTDNKNLFEYSLVTLSQENYLFDEVKLDLYADLDKDNIQTEYEKKFVSLGMPIYKLVAHCQIDKKK